MPAANVTIRKVEVRNYRSCVDTSVEFQPDLSVLIGPNGSGKTNVLHAIVLLHKLADDRNTRHIDVELSAADKCRLKAWFEHDRRRAILTADISLDTDESNADVVVGSKQTWYAKDYTNERTRVHAPLWMTADLERHMQRRFAFRTHKDYYAWERMNTIPDSFLKPFELFGEFVADIKYYSASQFTNPSHCPVSFDIEKEGARSRGLRLRGHSKFLFDLYVEYKNRSTSNYEQFFDVVGPNGIGLVKRIEFKEIRTSSIEYTVHSGARIGKRKREKILIVPQFFVGRNELSPSQLSEGTFKTITLLFYLMTEKSSALLIEEPEVCVHHGLLSSIIELIKTYSGQKQIVLSTHSDFVLDYVEPRHVYKVRRDNKTGTSVEHIETALSSQELSALRNYLESEGNLGEYWRHGGLD